jgi:hypothetical protein
VGNSPNSVTPREGVSKMGYDLELKFGAAGALTHMACVVGLVVACRKLSLLRPNLSLSQVTSPTFQAHLVH